MQPCKRGFLCEQAQPWFQSKGCAQVQHCSEEKRVQYRERIIFLGQAVDEELGNQLVGTILYLDSENHKDMRLYINTFGGDVSSRSKS